MFATAIVVLPPSHEACLASVLERRVKEDDAMTEATVVVLAISRRRAILPVP